MPNVLGGVRSPADLKKMTYPELVQLAAEIRDELISTVSLNGGHLASSLGTVELTIALHRAFNSPEDRIVWDVGHQIQLAHPGVILCFQPIEYCGECLGSLL